MQYNTKREELYMPEYGRHIQRLVDYVQTIEDKEKQQAIVDEILKLMVSINPNAKNVADYEHKLWDHLHIMANFNLDVASPYPKPTREEVYKKPEKFPYPNSKIKYRHYGQNVEKMIKKAAELEDDEKQEAFTEVIASFMKRTYENYHNESVNDDIIKEDLVNISDGELSLDDDQRIVVKRRRRGRNSGTRNSGSRNNKRRRNNRKRN